MKNIIFCALLSLILGAETTAQQTILLKNPSFEAEASAGSTPTGWINLGANNESPPDIQPGSFDVTLKPQHGETYVGMVVRDNNTWEGIGQRLSGGLMKDSAYTFSIWLARSPLYVSFSRMTGEVVSYAAPTTLKIWGVNSKTNQEELLAESEAIDQSKWLQYNFTLNPTVADFDEIDLMAYYAKGAEKKNGNLLMDNCSSIQQVNK